SQEIVMTDDNSVNFNDDNSVLVYETIFDWSDLTSRSAKRGIESTTITDLAEFSSPNETGNVTLVIGDKKVKVSKESISLITLSLGATHSETRRPVPDEARDGAVSEVSHPDESIRCSEEVAHCRSVQILRSQGTVDIF
ncbi:hypothetical protein PENTCL1PPCAC_9607, partial [Pristionchus entomophagus]